MGLIVSIVLGLIFYWEGRRLYKETEEHSKLQRIAITIKLGGISYLKSLFMLACLIAPAVIIGAGLAIGIAVTAFCLGLLIIYRTRKLEKDE